jgi:MFS family permease
MNPDAGQLPGSNVLGQLTNGIGGWALIAAMVGVVIGSVMWAYGHYSHNYQQAYNGRRGVMVSALAAVLIGGAPHIIGFLIQKGGSIQ